MDEYQGQVAEASITQEPGLTQMQRVTYTFMAPSKTFADIHRGNRSWWMPFLIGAVFAYLFFGTATMKIGLQQIVDNQIHMNPAQEAKMAQAPPDQRAMASKIALYVTGGVFSIGPLIALASTAIIALILWATINFGFGGKATYGEIFAVWMYASLLSVIKWLLGIVVILAGAAPETFNIGNFAPTNIGAFLDPFNSNHVLYVFASAIDGITIWMLILAAIGIAAVAGVKRSSGYIAVFGWWALTVLFAVAKAAI